ncbi:sigma factor-like helix-turn-helix DNA-binding protein [Gemmata sp. JC717]|uniref:sigma factor-like helix-turn-helix DNA-binding protein n=1 Tax=Gemmata algarum TaxID=2975278 RepID=UPI0021BB5665|nr:sigma factor-like helix-turn-helix DNA-binding protein [Gemmata algarum]MDY3555676.1 sigma factor-like helix-turn-helix DNA-binding protein [Gemmata algarum]
MPRLEFRRAAALCRLGSNAARPTDAELLARFAADRDEAAFAELVVRHGRLVRGTARRCLGDVHATEDVCQATFLVLAQKAAAGPWGPTVGPWLHATAVRLARKAAPRIPVAEPTDGPVSEPAPHTAAAWNEICRALDEELSALPEVVRGPLVLCYLQGHTRDAAAAALGCSLAMLKRRLERGRNLLRDRLTRRGISLPAAGVGVLATELVTGATDASQQARAAVAYLASGRAPVALSGLLGGGGGRWKAAVLFASLVACGMGLVGAAGRPDGKTAATETGDPKGAQKSAQRIDRFGDPLPAGALARFGTGRHRAPGAHVAVTPDGKTVVNASDDLIVRTYDAITGAVRDVRSLGGPPTYHTTLSTDGRYLAGVAFPAPSNAEIRVWELATGKLIGTLPVGREPVNTLDVHSGTTKIAFFRGPETYPPSLRKVCVWDFAKGNEPIEIGSFTPQGPRFGEPRNLFSPNGKLLLSHQQDGRLVCRDLGSHKVLWEKKLPTLTFFFFAPDGKNVVAAPDGSGFEFWSAADGAKAAEQAWNGKAVQDRYSHWPVAISASGRLVALFHGQRRVVLYDTVKRAVVRELNDPRRVPHDATVGFWKVPTTFAFTPDETGFVWRAPTVQRWDVATGKATWPVTWDQGHTEAVTRLLFAPGGEALVSAATDDTHYVWAPASGRVRQRMLKGYGDLMAFAPNGRTLITSNDDGLAPPKVWDLASGTGATIYKGDTRYPQYGSSRDRQAAVTPDGKRLVTLTDNGIARERIPPGHYLTVWDLAERKVIREEQVGYNGCVTAVAPDGEMCAIVPQLHEHPGARLVATATGKEIGRLTERDLLKSGLSRPGLELMFSADGRTVATRVTDDNGTAKSVGDFPVKLWDIATARAFAQFPTTGAARFSFAPDGRTLVIAGSSGFRTYELATRKEIHAVAAGSTPRVRPSDPFATALAVGPGGRTVATGHMDGTILIWDATPFRTALEPAEAGAAWDALKKTDAGAARVAVLRLGDAPELALRLFEERLKPAAPSPAATALVRQLDSEDFKQREAAETELRTLGSRAEPALTAALAGQPSPELRNRITPLMNALSPTAPVSGEDLRDVRAVEVLEGIGTPAARKMLDRLTTGEPTVRLTREAKAAVARLGGR